MQSVQQKRPYERPTLNGKGQLSKVTAAPLITLVFPAPF
jgi:hypothetical protein